eukprot:GEMP01058742.1.p1 GENE.GEMP01058742.1~~GEMP01058742.1.p1  ORF type:complete len:276 (+),score=59.05 GEMP01058742.1:43-870(+)
MERIVVHRHCVVVYVGSMGSVSHQGVDGAAPHERMLRYGKWDGHCGECLWYGRACRGLAMILALIIDDGVPSRGHRETIYIPSYAVVGVRIAAHRVYGNVAVIDFADCYKSDPEKVAEREQQGPPKIDPNLIPTDDDTQWTDLGECIGCGKKVKGGTVTETDRGKWHKECFVCNKCKTALSGKKYNLHDKIEYCAQCYEKDFAPRCERCKDALSGTWKVLDGKKYHAMCCDAHKKEVAAAAKDKVVKPKGKASAKTSFVVAKKNIGDITNAYGDF